MEYILLVVDKPVLTNTPDDFSWHRVADDLRDFHKRTRGVQLLAENVLLIPQDPKADLVSEIYPSIRIFGYKYAVLKEEPKWLARPKGAFGVSV